jgi:hypothetical protein
MWSFAMLRTMRWKATWAAYKIAMLSEKTANRTGETMQGIMMHKHTTSMKILISWGCDYGNGVKLQG